MRRSLGIRVEPHTRELSPAGVAAFVALDAAGGWGTVSHLDRNSACTTGPESREKFNAINGGATAPEGSPRRALAKQFFDAMHDAFTKRGKRPEMLKWLLAALKAERDGQIKNILTMRMPAKKKRRAALNAALVGMVQSADAPQLGL